MHVSLLLLGTGSVDSVGQGRGTFYSVNVPLKDGICDQAFTQLFARYLTHNRDESTLDILICYNYSTIFDRRNIDTKLAICQNFPFQ